jgi:hypothetical protein
MILRAVVTCIALCCSLPAIAQDRNNGILYIYATRGDRVEIGTGFFVDSRGAFLTAYHVVKDATEVDVYDHLNNKYTKLQLINADPTNDVAVLTVNRPAASYFTLEPQIPSVNATFISIGHPFSFKYQTFQARATQDGFADSLRLINSSGNGIFSKSTPIIPLDLTIYNGMSGGPIINAGGNVIGMLSGSFNVGGSLAWGIPSNQIIPLIMPMPSTRTDLAKVVWRPIDSLSTEFRGFAISKALNSSETVDWLNAKWKERGAKEIDYNGFTAHIREAQVTVNNPDKLLKFSVLYTWVGDAYRTRVTITLEDALRAIAGPSFRLGSAAYYPVVECPMERSCISFDKQKRTETGWKTLETKRMTRIRTEVWAMVDQDGAARAAMAINHLIQLHGGPIERAEAFGTK